jgi:hypothetical protein
VYSFDGKVEGADLTIRCPKKPLYDDYIGWIKKVFDSVETGGTTAGQKLQSEWLSRLNGSYLEQSFRKVSLEEALELL